MDTAFTLDKALAATGELLSRRGQTAAIVVVGGTALNLLGVIGRYTRDVDVIAVGTPRKNKPPQRIAPPAPLPEPLADAVATVARDLGLPPDWLNTTVGGQWQTGLPRGFAARIVWQQHGGLWVGLAGRADLISLKLYAAADDVGTTSRHFKDLVALNPGEKELAASRRWIRGQDPSPSMAQALDQVIAHVQAARR